MIHRSLLQKHLALVSCKNSSFAGSSTRGRVQTQGRSTGWNKQLAGSVVTDLGRRIDDVQVPFVTAQRADFQKKPLKKTSNREDLQTDQVCQLRKETSSQILMLYFCVIQLDFNP